MSDEAALLKAIIAHPDEDTPRLAYADWLDEHNDPDRAAFIRVQCRLADMSPADPEWVDLHEQQDELCARLQHQLAALSPKEPDEFSFGADFLDNHEEPFRRGFPYFIDGMTAGEEWNRKEINRVIKEMTRFVNTTTIRGISLNDTPLSVLKKLLAAPFASRLTGFGFLPHVEGYWQTECVDLYQFVAAAPALRGVKHLFLYGGHESLPAAELANAKVFDNVRRLTIQNVGGTKAELDALTSAAWFRRVQYFRIHLNEASVASAMMTGLGKLPDLHTLDLPDFAPGGLAALAKGEFPSLARLMLDCRLEAKHAKQLAAARLPALTVLEAQRNLKNDGFKELLKAKWFRRLRVLDLHENALGDQAIKALASHPVAKTLRVLTIGDNAFGKGGLSALAKPGAFPELTALNLPSYHKRKAKPAELAGWLTALQLPNVRHLNLNGWPLGNEGAKALAKNSAFANLTRLSLKSCKIGDPGAKAIFDSPHLQNLIELHLDDNGIKSGADALAKETVMPRLGVCGLNGNKIADQGAAKLQRDGLELHAWS